MMSGERKAQFARFAVSVMLLGVLTSEAIKAKEQIAQADTVVDANLNSLRIDCKINNGTVEDVCRLLTERGFEVISGVLDAPCGDMVADNMKLPDFLKEVETRAHVECKVENDTVVISRIPTYRKTPTPDQSVPIAAIREEVLIDWLGFLSDNDLEALSRGLLVLK